MQVSSVRDYTLLGPQFHPCPLPIENPCFTMRVLTADEKGDDGINSWDLSIFRYPRSQKCQQAIVNDQVKTLELESATVGGEEKLSSLQEVPNIVQRLFQLFQNSPAALDYFIELSHLFLREVSWENIINISKDIRKGFDPITQKLVNGR